MPKKSKARKRTTRPAQPTAIERAYTKSIVSIVRKMRRPVLRAVEKFIAEMMQRTDSVDVVDAAAPVTRSLAGLRVQIDSVVTGAKPGLLAQGVGKRTSAFAVAATDKVMRGVVEIPASTVVKGVDLGKFAKENVKLIKSIGSRLFSEVEAEVSEAWRIGRSTDVLARNISERFDVSENRGRLIARDQVQKLNSAVAAKRQKDLGVVEYEWSTSRDERVRGNPSGLYPDAKFSHWEREGQRFRYDEPPEDGHPGHAINCRCVAVPIIPDDAGDE